jgi:hypothetical protein
MDRYSEYDRVTDTANNETEYYMHSADQLQPLTFSELLGLDLFRDVDSMFSMGVSYFC